MHVARHHSGTNAEEICGDGKQIGGPYVSRPITCMLHCLVMLACRCIVRKIGLPLQKLSIACCAFTGRRLHGPALSGLEAYPKEAVKTWRSLLEFTAEELQKMVPSVDLNL